MSYLSVGRTLGSSLREAFGLRVGVLSIKAWWVEWLGSGPWEPVNQKQRLPEGRLSSYPQRPTPVTHLFPNNTAGWGKILKPTNWCGHFTFKPKHLSPFNVVAFFYTSLEEQVSIPLPVMMENLVRTSLCELRMVLTLAQPCSSNPSGLILGVRFVRLQVRDLTRD